MIWTSRARRVRSPIIHAVDVTVRPVATEAELVAAMGLRRQVFVEEQGVPVELERDEQDADAIHVVAVQDGTVVATGRLVFSSAVSPRIGRMAVVNHLRRRGLGSQVLACLEAQARLAGSAEVRLHAQLPAYGFYAHHGYTAHGGEFEEAGIRHIAMINRL